MIRACLNCRPELEGLRRYCEDRPVPVGFFCGPCQVVFMEAFRTAIVRNLHATGIP